MRFVFPRTDKAKLCTGYGVAMERTKISSDAPNYFLDPHFDYGIKHPHSDHHPRFARLAFTGTFTKAGRNNEPNESAHVLPGGQSILNATLNSKENLPKSNYRKFFHDKQVSQTFDNPNFLDFICRPILIISYLPERLHHLPYNGIISKKIFW